MTAPARDLCYELNRLASSLVNGRPTLAEDGAANRWAGTTGLGLVGALNVKAGRTPPNLLGLNAVCDLLGGTTNQDPAYALSQRGAP